MLNKKQSIKFSELSIIKDALPKSTIQEAFKLKANGTIDDIIECTKIFPKASVGDVDAIVTSRRFIRWYMKNKKVIALSLIALPAFSFAMYKLEAGSFALDLLAAGTQVLEVPNTFANTLGHALGSIQGAHDNAISVFATQANQAAVAKATMSTAVAAAGTTTAVAAAGTGFFAGKGQIMLHMLIVGFFTLVVCSFLKFTGRGDFIPLVTFVGGAVILYEVVGLFRSIYDSISTLLNM